MGHKYQAIHYRDSPELGVATSLGSEPLFLPDRGKVSAWQPPKLHLTDGDFGDYLANDIGVRLCSDKMRETLGKNAGPQDDLQWLPASVEDDAGGSRVYWVLHFPSPDDVISKERSIFADDFVVKLVLRRDRLVGHRVFSYSGGGNMPLIVLDEVREGLLLSGCTGFESSEVRAV